MQSDRDAIKRFCKLFWSVAPKKRWFINFQYDLKNDIPFIRKNIEVEIYDLMRSSNEFRPIGTRPILYSDLYEIFENLINELGRK